MIVGSVGYTTNQGLGILLKNFVEAAIVQKVITIIHSSYKNYDWFPGSTLLYQKSLSVDIYREFLKTVDTMLFFETPFDPKAFDYCKEHGVKTVLMPMYECTPLEFQGKPDLVINPSLLDQAYWPEGRFIPVPVPWGVTWKLRTRARTFVHNAGHLGLSGRNGTYDLIDAMCYVKSPIKLILRSQKPFHPAITQAIKNDNRIDLRIGEAPYDELYQEGDVFIYPERFNGLSLPLIEAKASGMLVMGTNRFPINTWTETEPLIPTSGERSAKPLYHEIKESVVSAQDIAATIDAWYDKDITEYSYSGQRYAEQFSWKRLRPVYVETLLSLGEKNV